MQVRLEPKWLAIHFPEPRPCLSWAICGGGYQTVRQVLWHQVRDQDLPMGMDPENFLKEKLQERGLSHAIAMLTSADLSFYQDVVRKRDGVEARCLATVGMSNALRIGDPPAQIKYAGTINLLCAVSASLSMPAMAEALSLVVEARTTAVLDAGLPSFQTGLPATGTGTDCVVLACAQGQDKKKENYAGKHTLLGSLIGEVVFEAVDSGLKIWKDLHPLKEVLL